MIRLLLLFLAIVVQGVNAAWSIGKPLKAFSGLTVKLDYPVPAARKPEEVEILYFKDEECTVPFTWVGADEPYFNADVYKGTGNGDGGQMMNVDIFMEVQGISESEIVNELNGQSYIAYCVRFQFRDAGTQEIMNKLDHEIIVSVDLKGSIGITGFLEDEEQKFAAGTDLCDADGHYVAPNDGVVQGNAVRFCVSPDENTQRFGVVINRIENLFFTRDDSGETMALIRDRGVVADPRITTVNCTTASVVCGVHTTPSNIFYTGPGSIRAIGEVVFMYNYNSRRRRTVRVPVEMDERRLGNLAGLDAGKYPFGIEIKLLPAQNDHEALMYRCNEKNQELTAEEQQMPLYRGDAVRVCAIPDSRAVENGVFLHNFHNFVFNQPNEHSQTAIGDGGLAFIDTLVICQSGDPVCAMKTYLHDDFFNEAIPVEGKATVRLQFGSERIGIAPTDGTDPSVAGSSELQFFFPVTTDDPPAGRNGDPVNDLDNWWLDTPWPLRVFYIVMFVILILLCLFCFFALLFGVPDFFGKKKKEQEDEEFFNNAPFIPPNKVKSNVVDNPHFCNALKNPEQWYADPNGAYDPSGDRGFEDVPEDEPEDDAPLLALDYWGPIDPDLAGGRKSKSNGQVPTPETSHSDSPSPDIPAHDDSSFVSETKDEQGYQDMGGYEDTKDVEDESIVDID
ncbi:unnamed protein product [Cylindrotheca closterium]|uniref:Uncharacterized protein n=1 Tax=Cylindrotheca closterium TaxID=2856 RepID=A0AAD2PW00_9STRA|nr:unnamed protein product [Cylindrotheca closterium]